MLILCIVHLLQKEIGDEKMGHMTFRQKYGVKRYIPPLYRKRTYSVTYWKHLKSGRKRGVVFVNAKNASNAMKLAKRKYLHPIDKVSRAKLL